MMMLCTKVWTDNACKGGGEDTDLTGIDEWTVSPVELDKYFAIAPLPAEQPQHVPINASYADIERAEPAFTKSYHELRSKERSYY